MDVVAQRITRFLYDSLCSARTRERCCALVRFYVTRPFHALDEDRRRAAESTLGGSPSEEIRCLTLLGTAGDAPSWNSPSDSAGHLAIPLPSQEMVARLPMVAQLLAQLGVDLGKVVQPGKISSDEATNENFDVFFVPEARGCPYVPAQEDFVVRHGVRAVVGFGGFLPSGELFTVILFSKVPIPENARTLFRTLALGVKVAVASLACDDGAAHVEVVARALAGGDVA